MLDFDVMKWLRVFDYKNLDSFLKSEKGKGNLNTAVMRVLSASLITNAVSFCIDSAALLIGGAAIAALGLGLFAGLGVALGMAGLLLFALVGVALAVAMFVVTNWTQDKIAVMLGGKPALLDLLGLFSYATAGMSIVSMVFFLPSLASIVPGAGTMAAFGLNCLLGPLAFALLGYMIYVAYRVMATVYGFDAVKAIGALLLNGLLWFIAIMAVGLVAMLVAGLAAAYFIPIPA